MIMTKLQKVLSGFIVLQVALVAVVFWPRGTAASEVGPLFSNLDIANIQRITIAGDISEERVRHLVDVAHRECFIANSLRTEIVVTPTIG